MYCELLVSHNHINMFTIMYHNHFINYNIIELIEHIMSLWKEIILFYLLIHRRVLSLDKALLNIIFTHNNGIVVSTLTQSVCHSDLYIIHIIDTFPSM